MKITITPTPEFRAACRIVLGGNDPATVIGAMRDDDRYRWAQVQSVHAAIVQLRKLQDPTIAAVDKIFAAEFASIDSKAKGAILIAAANIDIAEGEALLKEADEL
jgi:hypothetical protein